MEIKQLKSFVTVAECKSFSRAAQILYISQPSISTHILALEQEFNVKLIERTSKSLSLTKAGWELYEDAVKILKISDKMIATVGADNKPVVNIGASTVPSAYILPDIIAGYRKKNPDCSFSVTQSDSRKVIEGVAEGIFDVGFIGMECHERGLESKVIASDEMVIILPDNDYYRKLAKQDDAVRSILKEPMIIREEGSGSGEMFRKLLSMYDFAEKDLNIVARVNDHEAIINMVERGVGVSCISSLALNNTPHRNVIGPRRLRGGFERNFYVVYKKGALKKDVVGNFVSGVSI